MNVPVPNLIQTPVGAAATGSGIISAIVNVILPPVWPWLAHQDPQWRGTVTTVLIFIVGGLGGWLKVVMAKDQKMTLELTPSRLPTVQEEKPA